MKKILVLAAMVAVMMSSLSQVAQASLVLANWTFETSAPTTSGPHAAEGGLFAATSFASGFHTSGATVWSNPAGNGSTESFSSNNWTVGDYYQFTTSTVGFQNIVFAWEQTGSNTGPRDFTLQYDAGSGIQNVLDYSITNDSWSTNAENFKSESARSFNFSSISALNDVASVTFRLTMATSTAITGGTVATAGSGRVDNILIQATAVPEPSALLLVGSIISFGALRRRRS